MAGGLEHQQQLVNELASLHPTVLTSNNPVFMPTMYRNNVSLRLDSNIVFYEEDEESGNKYRLFDIFAVKGGQPIVLELGEWKLESGIRVAIQQDIMSITWPQSWPTCGSNPNMSFEKDSRVN